MTYQDKVPGRNWDWLLPKAAEESTELAQAATSTDKKHLVYEWLDVLKLIECALLHGDDAFRAELTTLLAEADADHREKQINRGNAPLELSADFVGQLVASFQQRTLDKTSRYEGDQNE